MRILWRALLLTLFAANVPAFADDDGSRKAGVATVTANGAKCDGVTDDTAAFIKAIANTPDGGTVTIPAGRCIVSDSLAIDRFHSVSFVGTGNRSQIFMNADKTLFDFQALLTTSTTTHKMFPTNDDQDVVGVSGVTVRDLFLGSAASTPGTALIKLVNSGHMRIENVTMMGSYYGIYLNGSLINTFVNLSGGDSDQPFFAAGKVSTNQYWVYGDRIHKISANANTFISPSFTGGTNGIRIFDTNSEGSLYIFGGHITGVRGKALNLEGTHLPSTITRMQFASNGGADVEINHASNIQISGASSDKLINMLGDSRNISISDTRARAIFIDVGDRKWPRVPTSEGLVGTGAKRILLQNIAICGSSPSSGIVPPPDFNPGSATSSPLILNPFPGYTGNRKDIVYSNIIASCPDN